jgi:hypothetical protein
MAPNTAMQMMQTPDESELISDNVTLHPAAERGPLLRIVEALLFAASEPVSEAALAKCLPAGADVPSLIAELQQTYSTRGVNLVQVSGKWTMRTAEDLAYLLRRDAFEQKKLSKAALETLAIVLIVLWILGLVSSYTMGGLIHILLVIALVALLFRLLRGQRR